MFLIHLHYALPTDCLISVEIGSKSPLALGIFEVLSFGQQILVPAKEKPALIQNLGAASTIGDYAQI
jgi:hypothetical protein